MENIGISDREAAIEIGQKLVDACVIEHVVEAQPFKDKYLFFRFVPESPILAVCAEASHQGVSFGPLSPDIEEPVELPSSVDVARLMCDPAGGIEVKNRKYHLKTYKKCFVGALASLCSLSCVGWPSHMPSGDVATPAMMLGIVLTT